LPTLDRCPAQTSFVGMAICRVSLVDGDEYHTRWGSDVQLLLDLEHSDILS